VPVLGKDLHVATVADDLPVTRLETQLLPRSVAQAADVGDVGKDVTSPVLHPSYADHNFGDTARYALHGHYGPTAHSGVRATPKSVLSLHGWP
jgi:hypothetical protein